MTIRALVTNDDGIASAGIRALAGASAQTALLQVTDLSTGFVQQASVNIAPEASAPFGVENRISADTG